MLRPIRHRATTRSLRKGSDGSTRSLGSPSTAKKVDFLSQKTSGDRKAGVNPNYPDDCPQALYKRWWVKDDHPQLARGRLVWAFLPHTDQQPMVLVAEGRTEATDHSSAYYRVEPLRIGSPPREPRLPVAALPLETGDIRIVQRAKRRPALVLSEGGPEIASALRVGEARWQTSATILVAPFYGVDRDGTRGGWKPGFVDRIRRCEYPQYLWDQLPLAGTRQSVLRLDHTQALGRHQNSYTLTPYRLSDDALSLVDEWFSWLLTGSIAPDSALQILREELLLYG